MSAIVLVVLAWAAVLTLAWLGQRHLVYFPIRTVPSSAEAGLDPVEQVTFTTDDGIRLHAWFVRGSGRSQAPFTIIVFNGNAGNRAYRAALARAFREHGLSVLLFDYRGFGENEGKPTEPGLASDARAARAYLASRTDVDAKRIVYFGESLGGAVAIRLAEEHPPAALVLRSPFTSLTAVGQHHYWFLPVRWLLLDRFTSIDRIVHVRCPLLVIAGDRDSIVPVEQSRRLYDAAPGVKQFVVVSGADHNDWDLVAGPQVVESTLRLLSLP